MSDLNRGTDVRTDDALDRLLKAASPRPTPSQEDEAVVRQAVKAEWQSVSGKRRSQRRMMQYALAATVLLGVFAVFDQFRTPAVESVQVGTMEKSFGTIYLLGKSSVLRETRELTSVRSGQTIVTGEGAGFALAWGNGGSVRVDQNTRVRFTSDDSVYLEAGRIYFDSRPSALITGISAGDAETFVVRTDHGELAHIGTQFMTRADSDSLVVSVREGRVAIDGEYHDRTAHSGEQVTFKGRQRPTVLSISRTGEDWAWVNRMAPSVDFDGKSLHQFLAWACREMGLELRFEGGAEQVAHKAILRGTIDRRPAEALGLRMDGSVLQHRVDGGVIYVSEIP